MKQDMWGTENTVTRGITDNAQYPAGTYIVFTAAAPYIRFLRATWERRYRSVLFATKRREVDVNHSDELCCAVPMSG